MKDCFAWNGGDLPIHDSAFSSGEEKNPGLNEEDSGKLIPITFEY